MANKDDIITLRKFPSEFEAQLAKSILEAAGIQAMIMGDDAGGMQPQLQYIRGVCLMIHEQDRDEAEAMLAAELQAEDESG